MVIFIIKIAYLTFCIFYLCCKIIFEIFLYLLNISFHEEFVWFFSVIPLMFECHICCSIFTKLLMIHFDEIIGSFNKADIFMKLESKHCTVCL